MRRHRVGTRIAVQPPAVDGHEEALGETRGRRALETGALRIDQHDATPAFAEEVFRQPAELVEDERQRNTARYHLENSSLGGRGVDGPVDLLVHGDPPPGAMAAYACRAAGLNGTLVSVRDPLYVLYFLSRSRSDPRLKPRRRAASD